MNAEMINALPRIQEQYGGMGGTSVNNADFAQILMAMSAQSAGSIGALEDGLMGGDLMGGGLMGTDFLSSGLFGSDMMGSALLGTGLFGTSSLMPELSLDSAKMTMMNNALQALMNAERPVVTDPVLANLLNMIKGTQGEDAQMQELMQKMKDRVQQLATDNGSQAAAQQMMAFLGGLMQHLGTQTAQDPVYEALGASSSEGALATILESSPSDILRMMTNAANGVNTANITPAGIRVQTQSVQGQTTAEAATTHSVVSAASAQNMAGTQSQSVQPTQTAQTTSDAPDVQHEAAPRADFETAVRSAVSKFSETSEDAQNAQPMDVDALQAKVDDGVYLRNTSMATNTQVTQQPVATQLQQPIQTAISEGREEVTVKLNPEELGEVTIKLTKSAEGDMTLALIAKKPETQQLLSEQMAALQDVMKPLKVDVESILTQRQYELLSHQQSFDNGQRQQFNPHRSAYYARTTQTAYEDDQLQEVSAVTAGQNAPAGVLNALA